MKSTEDPNVISLEIKADATNTRIGTITRDGEISDASSSTAHSTTNLYKSSATKVTAGTIETDLDSYTLKPRWMGTGGVIHVKASGVITGGTAAKTLTFYFGTKAEVIHASANDSGDWTADIYIVQEGARNAQRLDILAMYGTVILVNNGSSIGIDTKLATVIKFTAQVANVADSVSQRTMLIEGL